MMAILQHLKPLYGLLCASERVFCYGDAKVFGAKPMEQKAANSAPTVEEQDCCNEPSCCGPQVPFTRTIPKVGRNDPCPCGNGKKFKKCCGRGA